MTTAVFFYADLMLFKWLDSLNKQPAYSAWRSYYGKTYGESVSANSRPSNQTVL